MVKTSRVYTILSAKSETLLKGVSNIDRKWILNESHMQALVKPCNLPQTRLKLGEK